MLDELWIAAIIAIESAGDPNAVSKCGAQGLMQLMPATAAEMCDRIGIDIFKYDPFDPEMNKAVGSAYINSLYKMFGSDIELALAAYNAGPGRVRSAQRAAQGLSFGRIKPHLPLETQSYVPKVIREYARLAHERGLAVAAEFSGESAKKFV